MQRGHVGRPRMESLILGADVVEMKQLRLGDCIFGRGRPGGNVMQMVWRVNKFVVGLIGWGMRCT